MQRDQDDFEDEYEDADNDAPPPQDNQAEAFKRLQRKVEKLEKDRQKAEQQGYEKAINEIETNTKVSTWSQKVGNDKLGQVWLKTGPEEVSEEKFFSFAEELGFKPKEEGEEPPAQQAPAQAVTPDRNFHRTGGATAPNSQTMTPREVKDAVVRGEMSEADAIAAVRNGRVVVNPQT